MNPYLALLKLDGTMTLVGAPENPAPVAAFNLIMGRRSLAGSGIGGIRETQEMLDFCADHGIVVRTSVETISDSEDQRRLRAFAQGRRRVPLRDRQLASLKAA